MGNGAFEHLTCASFWKLPDQSSACKLDSAGVHACTKNLIYILRRVIQTFLAIIDRFRQ